MITVSIDGRQVKVPTQWKEVSYKDFIELSLIGQDLVGQLAYLLGMSKKEFETGTFSESLDSIFQATKFLASQIEINETPQGIGSYKPGTSINTMAQLNAITEQVNASVQTKDQRLSFEALATIAAIQCQGLYEPFDSEKAKYLAAQFMTFPCLEVFETGIYFKAKAVSMVYRTDLNKLLKLGRTGFKVIGKPSLIQRLWR